MGDEYIIMVESIKHGEIIFTLPYQTQVILSIMLSRKQNKIPTFFELGILLNLGHFDLVNDEEKYFADIYNIDYETGNDYQYFLESSHMINLFHCIIFHWFHGNIDGIKEGYLRCKGEFDEFIIYIRDYLILYESVNIDIQHKRCLYDEFMSLNINDYRFWLMPPPNLMPKKLEKDEVYNFYSFYDTRNRDHKYDAFYEGEKNDIMENLYTKFFKLYLMFPEMEIYKSIYYLVVRHDIEQADFYFENLNEPEKDEIADILIRITLNEVGDVNLQKFVFLVGNLNRSCHKSCLLKRIVSDERFDDPCLQFQIGFECIKWIEYENRIYFIDLSAKQKNELAIFYK